MNEEETINESEIDRGGCTIYGSSICPTLIAGYYKMIGTTQDKLTIVILGVKHEENTEEDSDSDNRKSSAG